MPSSPYATYSSSAGPNGVLNFVVVPAAAPAGGAANFLPLMLALLFALPVLMCSGLIGGWGILGLPVAVVGGYFAFKGVKKLGVRRLDAKRKPGGQFSVHPQGLNVGGRSIDKENIQALRLVNAMHTDQEKFVILNPTSSSSTLAGSSQAGAAARHRVMVDQAKVSWGLQAESRGEEIWLAGGMTEACARGLHAEVSKVLGIS